MSAALCSIALAVALLALSGSGSYGVMASASSELAREQRVIRLAWFQWPQCFSLSVMPLNFPGDPSIKLNVTCLDPFTYLDVIFADSQPPNQRFDLYMFDTQELGRAVESGLIVNVDDMIAEASTFKGDFFPSALSYYSEYPSGSGSYWGFPFMTDGHYLAYRADLFARAGFAPPINIQQMLEYAQFFQNNHTTKYGLAAGWCLNDTATMANRTCVQGNTAVFNQFVWMEGGEIWNQDTYRVDGYINSDASLRALEFTKKLYKTGAGAYSLFDFCAGNAAMMIDYMSDSSQYICPFFFPGTPVFGANVGVTAIPYNSDTNEHHISIGGMGLYVSATSWNVTLAKLVARHMTNPTFAKSWAYNGGFSARQSVTSQTEFLYPFPGTSFSPIAQTFAQSIQIAKGPYKLPLYNQLVRIANYYLQLALDEHMPARDALNAIAAEQQVVIDASYPCGAMFCMQPTVSLESNALVLGTIIAVLGGWTASVILEEVATAIDAHQNSWWLLALTGVPLGVCCMWELPFNAVTGVIYKPTNLYLEMVSLDPAGFLWPVAVCYVGCVLGLWLAFGAPSRLGIMRCGTAQDEADVISTKVGRFEVEMTRGSTVNGSVMVRAPERSTTGGDYAADGSGGPRMVVAKTRRQKYELLSTTAYMSYVFRRLLTRWVLAGGLVLTLTMEFAYFFAQRSVTSDVDINWDSGAGPIIGAGLAAYALVLAALLVGLHVPASTLRFGAGVMFGISALIIQLVNFKVAQSWTVTAIRNEHGDWTHADDVQLGVTVVCAVTCFFLLGYNVSRIKLSRHSLDDLLHSMKREMNKMQKDLEKEMEHATSEGKERATLAKWMEVIALCRPGVSNAGVALAMAPVRGWNPTAAQLKEKEAAAAATAGSTPAGVGKGTAKRGGTNEAKSGSVEGKYEAIDAVALAAFKSNAPPTTQLDESAVQLNLLRLETHLDLLSGGPLPATVYDQLTLTHVLEHPVTLEIFKDFLIAQKQEDSLMAWLNIRRYRAIQGPTVRQVLAASIFNTFLASGTAQEVNVSHTLRDRIGVAVNAGEHRANLFDEAAAEMLTLVRSNAWAAFHDSKSFRLCALILNHPSFSLNSRHPGPIPGGMAMTQPHVSQTSSDMPRLPPGPPAAYLGTQPLSGGSTNSPGGFNKARGAGAGAAGAGAPGGVTSSPGGIGSAGMGVRHISPSPKAGGSTGTPVAAAASVNLNTNTHLLATTNSSSAVGGGGGSMAAAATLGLASGSGPIMMSPLNTAAVVSAGATGSTLSTGPHSGSGVTSGSGRSGGV